MNTFSLWREAEPDQFEAAILAAAERLHVLPLAIEKDYWVCEALRSIAFTHPGEIVFKGGTSLEKLRIIRRFSEDLDLLVIGAYGSNRATERALKSMIEAAVTLIGGKASGGRSGGKPGTFHRSAYVSPPLSHSGEPGSITDAAAILIELGQSGGPHPHQPRRITSLLARELDAVGFDTAAWDDLAPLEVAILHPGRTLIEKLLRINNFANDPASQGGTHGWPRIGRQFYDVWALLGHDEVLTFLKDKAVVSEVLASCYEISQAFTPDLLVPDGGFSASSAFAADGALALRLRAEHAAAMDGLYYGTETPPTFDDVLQRVHANSALLTVE